MATEFTHCVRAFELSKTIGLIPANCNLLEIGAGDGWQANQLSALCGNVSAIDLPNIKNGVHFQVIPYDGVNIPFDNDSFDVIYTSNVLEHVVEINELHKEMQRVLRPGGIAIHCLPSSTWRVWTSISHPIYVAKLSFELLFMKFRVSERANTAADSMSRQSWPKLLFLALFSPRHGEHGSMLSEIWLFSRRHWTVHFAENGWRIIDCNSSEIFYTGNEILGMKLRNRWRSLISKFAGSSTNIFILKSN